jgi:hypothetical protein
LLFTVLQYSNDYPPRMIPLKFCTWLSRDSHHWALSESPVSVSQGDASLVVITRHADKGRLQMAPLCPAHDAANEVLHGTP